MQRVRLISFQSARAPFATLLLHLQSPLYIRAHHVHRCQQRSAVVDLTRPARQSTLQQLWRALPFFGAPGTILLGPIARYLLTSLPLVLFQTDINAHGTSVTTLWKAIRANKEDRVAKLEWAPNGGLGRAIIGKVNMRYRSDPADIVNGCFAEHLPHVRPGPHRPSHARE